MFPWTAFVCVSVLASQFSVQAGDKDQFFHFYECNAIQIGKATKRGCTPELRQQTRIRIGTHSEDVYAPLAFFSEQRKPCLAA